MSRLLRLSVEVSDTNCKSKVAEHGSGKGCSNIKMALHTACRAGRRIRTASCFGGRTMSRLLRLSVEVPDAVLWMKCSRTGKIYKKRQYATCTTLQGQMSNLLSSYT